MANAKKCDICGKYYDVAEQPDGLLYDDFRNTSMIRVLRHTGTFSHPHDVMQFDACERCLQDVLDYILTKRVESEKGETTND